MLKHRWDLSRLGYTNFPLVVALSDKQRVRMDATCFRTLEIKPVAGNFRFWGDFPHIMRDIFVCRQLALHGEASVKQLLEQKSASPDLKSIMTHLTIEHPDLIGWQSTMSKEAIASEDLLESFQLNKRVKASRVRKDSPLLAPATHLVTFKTQIWFPEEETSHWVMAIITVYPGEYIGELEPRNAALKRNVFFDWTHPAQLILQEDLTTPQRL